MPRSTVPSVARVYPNVNAERGPSWYEYGQLFMSVHNQFPTNASHHVSFGEAQTTFRYNGVYRTTMR